MRRLARIGLLLLVAGSCAVGCSSVEVVRLQPDLLKTPRGTEPLAGIQASCIGFYLFTLGIPECDMDRVINELLMKKARAIGAKKLIALHYSGTPESGIWWLTKLLWFRTATATVTAVMAVEDDDASTGQRLRGQKAPSSVPAPSSRPSQTTQPSVGPPAGGAKGRTER